MSLTCFGHIPPHTIPTGYRDPHEMMGLCLHVRIWLISLAAVEID